MNQNSLIKEIITSLQVKHKNAEKAFWDVANNENHTKEEEYNLARDLMVANHHLQIITSLEQLLEDKESTEFPIEYALEFFPLDYQQQIRSSLQSVEIKDNSELARQYTHESLTEDLIKKFLIDHYENNNDGDSNWEDTSQPVQEDELIQMNEEQIHELDKVIDEQLEMNAFKEEEEIKEQERNEEIQQKEVELLQEEELAKEYANYDQPIEIFKIHSKCICSIAQNPVQKQLFSTGSCDDSFKIFKRDQQEPMIQKFCNETVSFVSFSSDGKYLAIAILNGQISIFTLDGNLAEKKLIGSDTEPSFLCWHPKGNVVLAGFQDQMVWMWNAITTEVLSVFAGHEAAVTCGGFTLDGKLVLSGSQDQSFRIWSPKTSQQLFKISGFGFHEDDVVCFNQFSNLVATGSSDKTVCVVNIETGKSMIRSSVCEASIIEVAFSNQQQPILVAGDQNGAIYIFNWNQMRLLDKIKIAQIGISKIMYQIKENQFVCSSGDGKIIVFDHRQLNKTKIIQCKSGIQDMLLDEDRIMVCCENGCVYTY